jgi:hypothetical protein
MPWLQEYTDVDAPVERFIRGVDVTGFGPIAAKSTGKILGAVLGNEGMIIGWYRDAACEPPDWSTQAVVSGQSVTLTVPGWALDWQVDFYDTKTGTDVIRTTLVTRNGGTLTIPLPDFSDDIAFKVYLPQ